MLDMTDDAWLSELLRHGALPDAELAQALAVTLATRDPSVDERGITTRTLLTALDETWERGWQPADVVHVARRDATAGSVPLVVALIGEHARRSDAASRAPDAWVEQLSELGVPASGDPAVVGAWHRAERPGARRGVADRAPARRRAAHLASGSRPCCRRRRAGVRGARAPPRTRTHGDDRVLRRIRGLLTKAESTEFPEEAEALTAKAQELMTRYAVDAALLEVGQSPAEGRGVDTRRVHVRDPYVRAKMQLLAAVAEANDVRLVWYSNLGIANLVGVRADVAAVELLFTSLLLQVAQALSAAEGPPGAPGGVPVVPPVVPARLRAPDRRASRDRPAPRHGGGCGRARRRPAPRAAQPPGGGRAAGRRALPAGARQPEPGVRRRRWLVRRAGRPPSAPTSASAGRPCADRQVRPAERRFRGSVAARGEQHRLGFGGLGQPLSVPPRHQTTDDDNPAGGSASVRTRRIREFAREVLGFADFRPGQEAAMQAVVCGRDTLAVLPSGAGKTAIYQVAGPLLDGPVVVVSPAHRPAARPGGAPGRDRGPGGSRGTAQLDHVRRRPAGGPRVTAGRNGPLRLPRSRAAGQARGRRRPPRGEARRCSSSTRRTASRPGATTSGPTTCGWAASSSSWATPRCWR